MVTPVMMSQIGLPGPWGRLSSVGTSYTVEFPAIREGQYQRGGLHTAWLSFADNRVLHVCLLVLCLVRRATVHVP